MGRITQATESVGGTAYPVGYGYNPDNSLASITYPSGRVVQQSYDAIGRLQQINDGTTTYLRGLTYNAAGEALSFNYGNGVQAAFTYNEHLELASLRYFKSGAADLLSLKYDYTSQTQAGNNGQIQAVHYCTTDPATCNEDLTKTENFTYDPWSRLATAGTGDNATWGLSENYDRFGNRLQQNVTAGTGPSSQVTVDPATNRVTGTGYAYDAAGNMTNDSFHSYTYDAGNWLTQVDSGATATYTYLGALRVKKVASGTTTVYVYSGTKPIAEYAGGSLSKEYVYSGSQLLATVKGDGTTTYEHPDHLSIRAESDASGNLLRSWGHFPFGEMWYENLNAGGQTSKWQFTTYERDSESGLDYAVFRYYSNRLGRFMSADALGGAVSDPQTLPRYSYVRNDPLNLSDPLGLLSCFDHGTAYFDDNGNMIGGTFVHEYFWCLADDPGIGLGGSPMTPFGSPDDGGKKGRLKGDVLRRLLNPSCAALFGGLKQALATLFRSNMVNVDRPQGSVQAAAAGFIARNSRRVAATYPGSRNTYYISRFWDMDLDSQDIVYIHELEHSFGMTAGQVDVEDSQGNYVDYQKVEDACPPQDVETPTPDLNASIPEGSR